MPGGTTQRLPGCAILQVTPYGRHRIVELGCLDQLLAQHAVAEVLDTGECRASPAEALPRLRALTEAPFTPSSYTLSARVGNFSAARNRASRGLLGAVPKSWPENRYRSIYGKLAEEA